MAEIKVYYEPEMNLLTIFWASPRKEQICTEMDDGILLIKDSRTQEPIGIELHSYQQGDGRLAGISFYLGESTKVA